MAKSFWTAFFTSLIVSGIVCGCFYFFCIQGQFIEVPKIIGENIEEARFLLENRALRVFVSEKKPSDQYPNGTIISQNPMPYMEVRKKSVVNVVISTGEAGKRVPGIIGMKLADAKSRIKEIGLEVGEIKKVYSSKYPAGSIIEVFPSVGESVRKGTGIDLNLSIGVGLVRVPSLYGKGLEIAEVLLKNRNLSLGSIHYTCDEEHRFGIIITQSPASNTQVKKWSKVNITINREE